MITLLDKSRLLTLCLLVLLTACSSMQTGQQSSSTVSDPSANVTSPEATAMPEPLDEPPDQRVRSHGFNPGPVAEADAKR